MDEKMRSRILNVLESVEWASNNDFGDPSQCPVCFAFRDEGHEENCDLAILKKELEQ